MTKLNYQRTCLHCKYLYWSPYSRGYSELTPSTAPMLECQKKHFKDGEEDYIKDLLLQAQDCVDFEDEKP